jgi:hypothetical protein
MTTHRISGIVAGLTVAVLTACGSTPPEPEGKIGKVESAMLPFPCTCPLDIDPGEQVLWLESILEQNGTCLGPESATAALAASQACAAAGYVTVGECIAAGLIPFVIIGNTIYAAASCSRQPDPHDAFPPGSPITSQMMY